jgi:hypothetical protein
MRFRLRAAVRHHIPRQTYRITNWRAYEAGLRNRGSLTVWFSEAAIAAWKGLPSGKQGGQPRSCELAIETALTLRIVFRLALRQCEGLIGSVMHRLGIDLAVPDHTTLSRRVRELKVDAKPHSGTNDLHLIVDSTGLKRLAPATGCRTSTGLAASADHGSSCDRHGRRKRRDRHLRSHRQGCR